MTELYKAILTKTTANKTKIQKIIDLLPMWKEGLKTVLEIQKQNIQKGEKIGWIDTKTLTIKNKTQPTQRQWKNIVNQVNNDLKTWRSLIIKNVKPKIYQIELSGTGQEKELKELFILNKTGQWYKNKNLTRIVEELIKKHPYPSYDKTKTMLMDGLIAEIQEKKKDTKFERWIRVSHPNHSPIFLPLPHNPYLENYEGTEQLCQFIVKNNNELELRIVKKYKINVESPKSDTVIGVDWGLKNLITTSEGKQYGRQLYGWLLERDNELLSLTKALSKNNINPRNSKRYRRLNKRIHDYVVNEVGRIVNILNREQLKTIVVEDLDFRGGGLSKRLNRIITRAGRKVLRQRLNELSSETGVEIVSVVAPYSSQCCNSCGFVSRKNRKSQAVFYCRFCGLRLNADVNAARNVKDRRSISIFNSFISKETILEILDQEFNSHWGLSFDQYNKRFTSRSLQ